ncbi:MAG: DUF5685 family protein [Clostridiales bacterium]|nr:DUF5685 family protein [Clostridiales bacterium]
MLGYVRAYKPELKFREYDIYKGIYCTICKQLLKRYSPFAQLFLSYDATFLAMLRMAVKPECVTLKDSRCCYNPLKKCKSCGMESDETSYCADVSVIIFYYKLLDNISDKGFFKKLLSILFFPIAFLMHKKAARLRPEAENAVRRSVRKQAETEKNDCGNDAAADSSASALAFLASFGFDGETERSLSRLGYLVGKFVYLSDSADDLSNDIRQKNFNPLIKKYDSFHDSGGFYDYLKSLFEMNIGETLNAYDALHFYRFDTVIYNVLFYGLTNTEMYILKKYSAKEVTDDEKSV